MTLAVLINGELQADPAHAIAANDRGLHYGDGIFETMLVSEGRVRFLDDHLRRLAAGCERLGIRAPGIDTFASDVQRASAGMDRGVLKIIVSRGPGLRGYRPGAALEPTRVILAYPPPEPARSTDVELRWCDTRLGRNPRLAGIKHLNRLEQVLAQAEWSAPQIEEGLMLDTEGELVCGTASNVFLVRDGLLVTPDLRYCGVRGVMRAQVLRAAARLGIRSSEEPLWPHDVAAASEVFITNAVRGIRCAGALGSLRWSAGPMAGQLRAALES